MANTSSGDGGDKCSTTIDVHAVAHAAATSDVQAPAAPVSITAATAANKVKPRKQLKRLSNIVFWILLLEWAGHAVGTLAFLWATVVILGGFSTMLGRIDFWFSTIMVFMEGTRVFVRSDTSVSQWLFGSTRAFRWDDFPYPPVPQWGKEFTISIGVGISFIPLDHLRSEIAGGILKVALLVIFSKLLTARNRYVTIFLFACMVAGIYGPVYGWYKMLTPHKPTSKHASIHAGGKTFGVFLGWSSGLTLVGGVASIIGIYLRKHKRFEGIRRTMDCCLKAMVASALACLPFLQAILGSRYKFVSIPIAVALYALSSPLRLNILAAIITLVYDGDDISTLDEACQQNNALLLPTPELLVRILERLITILVLWSMVFPFPGISLRISFYILFSLLAAALVGNLQIPVAFLQVLLSGMRLHSLLGHHHHRAYDPLPDGATTNLVPSIVVFYVLELWQGSAYIMGIVLGIVSFCHRRSLAHALWLSKEEWGAKAVNLYQHHVYEARTAKGLFPTEKYRPPSLQTFAIESLGSTSSQMDIVRLHVLHHYLLHEHHQGADEKEKLIAEIANDANKGITTKIIGIISSLAANLSDNSAMLLSSLCLSVTLLWELATIPGKIGSRFRQELLENSPLLLNSAQRMLGTGDSKLPTEAMINIVATLAMDEGARQEIGSNQAIMTTLIGAFLSKKDLRAAAGEADLRAAAGEALANLTIMSTDNCWAILKADPNPPASHHLIKDLVTMLQLKDDKHICIVAANLLRNLCANSGDMLIHDLGAKEDLRSALQKVMETIKTTEEGKQLEATLSAASQIGYVIPEYFAEEIDENLVKKLVDTLHSNRRPCPECPRIRRALIELVISIVTVCPHPYTGIFRKLGVKDALDMVKGTSSSRLEKYMLFVGDEGMVLESTPLSCLVDEAIKLFNY